MKEINKQEALDALSFWTALEVLTYKSFKKPAELLDDNDESQIFTLKNDLPWERASGEVPRGKQLFYEIIIGTLNAKKALNCLNKKYNYNFNPVCKF